MKKISLIIITIFLIVAIFLTAYNPEEAPSWITALISIFGLFTSYLQYLYNNWDSFFILINKQYAKIKGDTVSWKGSYKFYTDTEFVFEEEAKKFKNEVKNSLVGSRINSFHISEKNAEFSVDFQGYERKITLFVDSRVTYNQLRINYSSSTSYKDSINEIDNFFKFSNLYSRNFIIKDNISDIVLKDLFSVELSFKRFNPFYRLTIKHLGNPENIKFSLKFREETSDIKILNNKIEVHSESFDELKAILKNYVALASIDNHSETN